VTERRLWLAFLSLIGAWGSSYLFMRVALGTWTPAGMVATRFGIAALLCFIIARVRAEVFPRGGQLLAMLGVGVLMMSGSNLLTAWAQRTVSSGLAGVVHSLGSVWLAALGSLPMLARPSAKQPRPAFWLGVVGGVVGVAVLLLSSGKTLDADLPGLLALVAATLVFAVASLVQRAWQAKGPVALFAQLAVQMVGGATVAGVVALFTGFVHAPVTLQAVGTLAWLVVVPSILGFVAFAVVLRGWPPARAGSYAVINPLVSVGLGVLFLGERVSLVMVAGGVLTLASVAWVQWCHR
jgi:drug/metabolite transporter (DMT)-like permease